MDVRGKPAPSLELEDSDQIGRIDQCLVIGPLFLRENALVCSLSKCTHSFLNRGRKPEGCHALSRLCVETLSKGIQQFVKQRCIAHAITVPRESFRRSTPVNRRSRNPARSAPSRLGR